MEKEYVRLTEALMRMEVNSVLTAQELTGLSRAEIIDFVRKNPKLRIFDNISSSWINETAEGHC